MTAPTTTTNDINLPQKRCHRVPLRNCPLDALAQSAGRSCAGSAAYVQSVADGTGCAGIAIGTRPDLPVHYSDRRQKGRWFHIHDLSAFDAFIARF